MKAGDLVRIKEHRLSGTRTSRARYRGVFGVVIGEAKRLRIPAVKVFVKGEVAEFDLDELETVK